VDLGKLAQALRRRPAKLPRLLLVGHLAHLLPVDAILLLRCNPLEIGRRLRIRGDVEKDVRQNMEAEWTDVILFETVGGSTPIFEHDGTQETPRETAQWVERVLRGEEPPGHGTVDWLGKSPPEAALPPSI
jgi:adenylate kinase